MDVNDFRRLFRDGFEEAYCEYRTMVEAERERYEAEVRSRWYRRALTRLGLARFFPVKHRHEFMVPDRRFW
jgi:hypothetical protein